MHLIGRGWLVAAVVAGTQPTFPSWPLVRVLGLPWLRAMGLVQGGGIGLLALGVAVESASTGGELAARLLAEVPRAWALLAAPLALAGSALALVTMERRGAVLALGTLGASRRLLGFTAFSAGLLVGTAAQWVGTATMPANAIVRVTGGWLVRGASVLDVPGTTLLEPDKSPAWVAVAFYTAAASMAGATGTRGPWTLVACASVLVIDLVRRGLDQTATWPAVIIGLAALAMQRRRWQRAGA